MPFGIQPIHIIVIVIVALIIFGPQRLPELGRSLGKGLNEFRRGTKEMTDSFKDEVAKPVSTGAAEPMAKPAEAVFCPQCGTANPLSSKFCSSCGTQLPV